MLTEKCYGFLKFSNNMYCVLHYIQCEVIRGSNYFSLKYFPGFYNTILCLLGLLLIKKLVFFTNEWLGNKVENM